MNRFIKNIFWCLCSMKHFYGTCISIILLFVFWHPEMIHHSICTLWVFQFAKEKDLPDQGPTAESLCSPNKKSSFEKQCSNSPTCMWTRSELQSCFRMSKWHSTTKTHLQWANTGMELCLEVAPPVLRSQKSSRCICCLPCIMFLVFTC